MRTTLVRSLLALVVVLGALCAPPTVTAQPLAEVDGEAITAEEVDTALRVPLGKLEEQIYQLRRQRVDGLVRDRLLAQEAKRRGLSVQALLDREVTSKVTLVTEEEVEQFYQANKARFPGDEAAAREQIRNGLQGQKLAAKRDELVTVLRSRAKVVLHLPPPPVVRVAVGVDGAPSKGSAGAPVTIVELSDFLCPFCQRVRPTLQTIERRYGDKVRFAFRDYPIEQLHPGATKAAEAARCAAEQGKFWPYHDLLFQRQRASLDDLKGYAAEVGLDVPKFESCVTSGKHAASVQKDIDEGTALGVSGTPAFFINGRLVTGAQPVEAFAQIIDDELSRK